MSVQLTAAGRSAPLVILPPDTNAYLEWKRAVLAMLTVAKESKPVRDRIEQMESWLAANPFHEQHDKRYQQWHLEQVDHFVTEGRICDLSEKVEYWQHRLSEEQRLNVESWLGIALRPGLAYGWAKVAQWIGVIEVPVIVAMGEKVACPF